MIDRLSRESKERSFDVKMQRNLPVKEWEDFKVNNKKSFADSKQENTRKQIFIANVDSVTLKSRYNINLFNLNKLNSQFSPLSPPFSLFRFSRRTLSV